MPSGWFYNSHSGMIRHDSGVAFLADEASLHLGIGWHGPFPTKAAAEAFAQGTPGFAAPTGSPVTAVTQAGGQATSSLLNGALQWTGASHFFLRFAEAAVGLVLLALGLNALLKGAPARAAAGAAKVAAVA